MNLTDEEREALVIARKARAFDTWEETKGIVECGYWHAAANRMYYACFHAVSALLIKNGIEVKSHMGIRQAFGLHFVKAGKVSLEYGRIFSRIYDKRQSSDYDDFIDFTKEEVEKLYPQIKSFIMVIGNLVED